jgi:signal transduction histidine kinase
MTLRAKLIAYLVAVHLPFAAVGAFLFRRDPLWLLAVEAALAISIAVGVVLVRRLFVPLELVRSGASLLAERDFTTRFLPAGQRELDELVAVYNRMSDHLREERVRAEETQSFLARVLTASPTGVVTLDLDSRVAFVNPCAEAMLGKAAEIAGRRLDDLPSPFARALVRVEGEEAHVLPLRGSRRVKAQRGEFLDRGFPRTFYVLEELTEELRRSEKAAYEKLIRMMSHEVNNSLGAARSLLESWLPGGSGRRPPDPDFEEALAIVLARMDRLSSFMRELADVARLPPPRPRPTDVAELLRGAGALLARQAEARGVAFALELADPLAGVPADAAQLEQALVNVVKNAVEAAGRGGVVTLRSGRVAGRRFLAVEDTGPGIPEDARADLFRPFYTTKENGQGLGLTVVREVLAAHGFEFALESAPGEPTRFTVLVD